MLQLHVICDPKAMGCPIDIALLPDMDRSDVLGMTLPVVWRLRRHPRQPTSRPTADNHVAYTADGFIVASLVKRRSKTSLRESAFPKSSG